MPIATQLISVMALAVARRKPIDGQYNGLTFSIWYYRAIPVITVTHPVSGVIYEELASDKPEIMSQMLAPWFSIA